MLLAAESHASSERVVVARHGAATVIVRGSPWMMRARPVARWLAEELASALPGEADFTLRVRRTSHGALASVRDQELLLDPLLPGASRDERLQALTLAAWLVLSDGRDADAAWLLAVERVAALRPEAVGPSWAPRCCQGLDELVRRPQPVSAERWWQGLEAALGEQGQQQALGLLEAGSAPGEIEQALGFAAAPPTPPQPRKAPGRGELAGGFPMPLLDTWPWVVGGVGLWVPLERQPGEGDTPSTAYAPSRALALPLPRAVPHRESASPPLVSLSRDGQAGRWRTAGRWELVAGLECMPLGLTELRPGLGRVWAKERILRLDLGPLLAWNPASVMPATQRKEGAEIPERAQAGIWGHAELGGFLALGRLVAPRSSAADTARLALDGWVGWERRLALNERWSLLPWTRLRAVMGDPQRAVSLGGPWGVRWMGSDEGLVRRAATLRFEAERVVGTGSLPGPRALRPRALLLRAGSELVLYDEGALGGWSSAVGLSLNPWREVKGTVWINLAAPTDMSAWSVFLWLSTWTPEI